MAERAAGTERIVHGRCGPVWISSDPATDRDRIRLPPEMERLEDWLARTAFLHAHRSRAGTGAGLHPSASQSAGNRQRAPEMGGNIFLYRCAGRTLLSRLGTELAGATRRTVGGSGDRGSSLWPIAFQQTGCAF